MGCVWLSITSHYFLVVSYFGVLSPRITGISHSGAGFALAMLEDTCVRFHAYAIDWYMEQK